MGCPVRHRIALACAMSLACSMAAAPCAGATAVSFDLAGNHYAVVQVTVNGTETAVFAVDTASSITVITPRLVQRLDLAVAGTRLARTPTEARQVDTYRLATLRLSHHEISGLEVVANPLAPLKAADPRIEGILGQDVLQRWNYLIDYREGALHVDADGVLAARALGPRVAITRAGRRILVPVEVVFRQGASPTAMLLALDSGAAAITIYEEQTNGGRRFELDRFLHFVRLHSIHGSQIATKGQVNSLRVGTVDLGAVAVTLAPRPDRWAGRREHGLLPARSFEAIYVDNRNGVVVLDPTFAPQPVPAASEFVLEAPLD